MTVEATNTNWITSDTTLTEHGPAWLHAERVKHMQSFREHGLPGRKNERWKYADFKAISSQQYSITCDQQNVKLAAAVARHKLKDAEAIFIVFVDGVFAPQYSDLANLSQDVIACGMRAALTQYEDLVQQYFSKNIDYQQYPFAAINTALFSDGLFLHVPTNAKLDLPLHVLYLSSGKDANMMNPNNLLLFGENSQSSMVIEYAGLAENNYFTNAVTTIATTANAEVDIVKLQHESKKAIHMENFFIAQKQDSKVSVNNIATGACFARDDIIATLSESGAVCSTSGFYHAAHDNQYMDNHVEVNHFAANTQSEMLYKGIADKKSRTVFNGRLHVQKDAQKINAYQANHNLLLSNHAEVYSKPELEIYADDVKCKHGATTGQIDQDALFYMRARGIDEQEATRILLRGFADEVIERISHPAVKQQAKQQVDFL